MIPGVAGKELGSGSNLLIARGVVFGIYPLCMAVATLVHHSTRITRDSLRPPFFSQCYVAAPFAFVVGLAFDFLFMPHAQGVIVGVFVMVLAVLWYAQAEIRWFSPGMGVVKATAAFAVAFLVATLVAFTLAVTIGLEAKNLAS